MDGAAAAPVAWRTTASLPLRQLINFFETLSPANLPDIGRIYAAEARFRDPFNEVQGRGAIRAIFEDMFVRTRQPRFVITRAVEQGEQAFVTWDFTFSSGTRALRIQGCSHLHFDDQGLVILHRDYWDAAGELYEQLPLLGVLMRALRRKLSAGH